MSEFIQPSFSSGEIAPAAYGRVDLAKYQTALKTCHNFLTRVHGGVVNRPGTEFIAESKSGRFIPFIFNEQQAYVLDFHGLEMSVINNGGYILEPEVIINVNVANPPVFTSPFGQHGFVNGDRVFVTGTNNHNINNQFWSIINATLTTFQLSGVFEKGILAEGSKASKLYKIASPYISEQLPHLSFAQLRDVMTITINNTPIQNLLRLDHTSWVFEAMEFEEGPFQNINVEDSRSMEISATFGGIVIDANFAAFTDTNIGQLLYIEQKDYGTPWEVGKAVIAGEIRRSEGKYYISLDAGTTGALRPFGETSGVSEHDGAVRWEYIHSGYGIARIDSIISISSVNASVLSRLPEDLVNFPSFKWAFGAWGGDQGWPAVVTYFQQRRTFFSTPAKPEYVWMSGTNAYTYFGKSTPVADDDSLSMQLVSKQVSPVRFAVEMDKLIAFTANGKWVIPGDDNNPVLTPSKRSARPQGALGSSIVPPAQVEDSILYIVEKGQTVQDISYQFVNNAYAGKDLSVLSKHLFEKHTIVAAAYQHVPFQVYWLVRSDGALLGCTYLREHEVWGWHQHDFHGGFAEDVCVIPEGAEDRVYLKIRRVIGGVSKVYTERLTSRLFTDIKDAHFVDSGLKYDGRNTTATTMTIVPTSSAGGGFGSGGFGGSGFGGGGFGGGVVQGSIQSSIPYFSAVHIGDEIHFPYEDKVTKAKIIGVTSPQLAMVEVRATIPPALLNAPTTNWGHAKYIIEGLNHLTEETISILADGKVHPQLIVKFGVVTLQYAAVVITAGLPIHAVFETLNLNAPTQGSILDREKCLFAARLTVEETRGIFAGPDADHLDEYVQRELEPYEAPVALKTGLVSIRVDSTWEPGGRVLVQQLDPLPISILNVMPDVDIGGAR